MLPKHEAGPAGHDSLIGVVEHGRAHEFGVAHDATVWQKCRHFAMEFLKEEKERLPGDVGHLFDEAIGHYKTVADDLRKLVGLFPFPPKGDEPQSKNRRETGLQLLRAARDAEAAADIARNLGATLNKTSPDIRNTPVKTSPVCDIGGSG